jgi:ATP-dependent exoDNAse (exonuclease V) beta subunit
VSKLVCGFWRYSGITITLWECQNVNRNPQTCGCVPKDTNPDGEFQIVQRPRAGDETHGIACYVKHLIEKKNCKPGDILILSPRRNFAYSMRDTLTIQGVPSHSFYHEESLEADDARHAFAYLTLCTKPKDRVVLRYLLGCKSNTWEARGYQVLRNHCRRTTWPHAWDALLDLETGTSK